MNCALRDVIAEIGLQATGLGFQVWQLGVLIAFFLLMWGWRGAKVPIIHLGWRAGKPPPG